MFTLIPVDLFRFSSCDTTTCSSFVIWQSNSNISVPIVTALKNTKKNNDILKHKQTLKLRTLDEKDQSDIKIAENPIILKFLKTIIYYE